MAYSDILKLKKNETKNEERTYVQNLIVGSNIFTASLFQKLSNNDIGEIKVLTESKFSEENFISLGPSSIRGESNISLLKELGSEVEAFNSVFYKDMKFHKFGSRSKPMKLLWGEEYFTQSSVKVDEREILKLGDTEELLNLINNNLLDLKISSIEKLESEELIEKKEWALHCTNGVVVECENLYWGETPYLFLDLLSNKKALSNEAIQFLESTKTPCALYVQFQFEESLIDKKETIFFPLSFTHDWGHFIGDVINENSEQTARFVTYVDKDESSEEDISKKIRLLKKNIEKNFDKFKTINFREQVILSEFAPCSKIDDQLVKEADLFGGTLKFFSYNAPIDHSNNNIQKFGDSVGASSHFIRGLLSEAALLG